MLFHQSTSLDSCGRIDLGIEAGNGPISSISVPAHSPNKFALLFAMPNNQPGVLEHITQNKENLTKTSAELLKKEEELSQVKTPKKLKGLFSQIPASTDVTDTCYLLLLSATVRISTFVYLYLFFIPFTLTHHLLYTPCYFTIEQGSVHLVRVRERVSIHRSTHAHPSFCSLRFQ